jgi:hypothetical protein
MIVVNALVPEYTLVPPTFEAFTRQKYRIPFCNPTAWRVVSDKVLSMNVVAKSESCESWNRYDVTRASTFHTNVSVAG